MTEAHATAAYRPGGCTLGCLAALAMGSVLLVLGSEVAGSLCFFVVFSSALVQAFRERSYRWVFSERTLRREAHPRRFWSCVALNAVFALASLWMLVDDLRNATS